MIIEVPSPTLIAEGTRLQGTLTFGSGTQVFGTVDGNVELESLEPFQVGKTGWVHGTINARGPVLVEGRVDGDIHSATRIRLLPSAIVRGALVAPSVEIRAGAVFDGDIRMARAAEKKKAGKAA